MKGDILIETAIVQRLKKLQEENKDIAPSLHMTNAFTFVQNSLGAKELAEGYVYTRIANPTNSDLEIKLSFLDSAADCVVTASGHAAQFTLFHALMEPGDEFIAAPTLYGGSINMFAHTFRDFGWQVVWCDVNNAQALESAITPRTKLIFAETLANPSCVVCDIEAIGQIARRHGLPLLIDNSAATPFMIQPKNYGADIILYSLSKYMGGHGNAIAGAIVECGSFPWADHPRFRKLNEPRPEYDNIIFSRDFPQAPLTALCRSVSLRDLGGCISPFNSYTVSTGLQTLHVRMQRHLDNAMRLARFLNEHPAVVDVFYPGLESNPSYAHAKKYFFNGAGGLVSFRVKGGAEKAQDVMQRLKLFRSAVNFGDVESMICHPYSTTHAQLAPEKMAACGVTDDLLRLSVGLEHAHDLIADIKQALESEP